MRPGSLARRVGVKRRWVVDRWGQVVLIGIEFRRFARGWLDCGGECAGVFGRFGFGRDRFRRIGHRQLSNHC